MRATFLESWSYCAESQECLADEWNYIDRPCANSNWQRGAEQSLDQCEVETSVCPEFVASKQYDLGTENGRWKNLTWVLPSGSQCYVKIDATSYVGRVLFDDIQGSLGIEGYDPDYDITQKISFENEVGEVLIYNAAETGSLRFTISFSGAQTTLVSVAAAVTMTALALF